MKLSGHNYGNSMMDELIKNISAKPENKPTNTPRSGKVELFSSTTSSDYDAVRKSELHHVIDELSFAANKAGVSLSNDQMRSFADEASASKLRGKPLERAAKKYCNQSQHETSSPISSIKNNLSANLLDNANNHAVIPAGYSTEHGQNDNKTGGYMGMLRNPNSIWDSGRLADMAQRPTGDEQIKASKAAKKQLADNQKQEYWSDLQNKMSQPGVIHEKASSVANVSTVEHVGNQNMPANSISMWGKNGFENMPDKTAGESLKQSATDRTNKKDVARAEWDNSQPCKKAESTLFSNDALTVKTQEVKRSSLDRLFEGLNHYYNKSGK